MKKIMITGAGILTTNFILKLGLNRKVSVVSRNQPVNYPVKVIEIDLRNTIEVSKLIDNLKPEIIINTAAMTSIDRCEQFPESALQTNFEIPKMLSELCKQNDIYLVHISTDQFIGDKGVMNKESTSVKALNVYGRTKLLGEEVIRQTLDRSLIIRTNFVGLGGERRFTFLEQIVKNLSNDKEVFAFDNYFFNPVTVDYLVEILELLYLKNTTGIVNITSDECISKFKFAQMVADEFSLNSALIFRADLKNLSIIANRPNYLCLDNTLVKNILGLKNICFNEQLKLLRESFFMRSSILNLIGDKSG
jgi:dTDP-4-dehydrorhamnose reductase